MSCLKISRPSATSAGGVALVAGAAASTAGAAAVASAAKIDVFT
jgi:hypothetical protein